MCATHCFEIHSKEDTNPLFLGLNLYLTRDGLLSTHNSTHVPIHKTMHEQTPQLLSTTNNSLSVVTRAATLEHLEGFSACSWPRDQKYCETSAIRVHFFNVPDFQEILFAHSPADQVVPYSSPTVGSFPQEDQVGTDLLA